MGKVEWMANPTFGLLGQKLKTSRKERLLPPKNRGSSVPVPGRWSVLQSPDLRRDHLGNELLIMEAFRRVGAAHKPTRNKMPTFSSPRSGTVPKESDPIRPRKPGEFQ